MRRANRFAVRHARVPLAMIIALLALLYQVLLVDGCQVGFGATNRLNALYQRTSPTRSGEPPQYQPTGLLGDIVASSRKRPASQQHHTPTGLLGDVVHQGTSKNAKLSVHPGQSSDSHSPAQLSKHSSPLLQAALPHVGIASQSKDKGAAIPGRGEGRPRASTGKPSNGRSGNGAASQVVGPSKILQTATTSQTAQNGLATTTSQPTAARWWNVPGGRPPHPAGTSPRSKEAKAYRERQKLKEQGPSLPKKPSQDPKRRSFEIRE
ncbi:unnamed protein product [Sympodiomycopsis kandeliae]